MAERRVDADLPEQIRHAESPRFVGDDRNDAGTERLVSQKVAEQADGGHGRRHRPALGMEGKIRITGERRHGDRWRRASARRQIAAERPPPLAHIDDFPAVVGRAVEIQSFDLFVAERQGEAIPEYAQRLDIELLRLVGGHPRLARSAHAKTLLGLGEDDRRLSRRRLRQFEGGVKLAEIMAAALQRVDVAIRHVGDERANFGVLVEEMREIVGAVLGAQLLILAVDGGGEPPQQRVIDVAGEEHIPFRAPQDLDHVPAGAAKDHLEFLDDLAVAAHRTIEPLQVAIDDEGQIVELFPRGEGQAGERFRLVHFAVAKDAPDAPAVGLGEAAIA